MWNMVERKYCAVNNDDTATQGTHSLFTPLASTPDELLAVIFLGSSLSALMDNAQIIRIIRIWEIIFKCLVCGGQKKKLNHLSDC